MSSRRPPLPAAAPGWCCASRRPIFGPMTPGVKLSERIEQTQILVVAHAADIFSDRTAERHHVQALRPFGRKRLDCIVDLQRALAVTDQQVEGCRSMFEQSVKYVRRARAVAKDRCAGGRGRLLRGRCGKFAADAGGLRGGRRKPALDQRLAAEEI